MALRLPLSDPAKIDLLAYRGDTGRFRITISDDDGDPVDITAADWDGDIRLKPADELVIASFDIEPVVGDPSSVDVRLSSENSELLPNRSVYDIEMRLLGEINTLMYGTITTSSDVSRP